MNRHVNLHRQMRLWVQGACLLILSGFGFALFASSPAAHAQPTRDWSAWVVVPSSGEVVQINPMGDVIGTFYLPIPQAFNAVTPSVAVSSDGRFLAYIATDTTLPEYPNTQLFVYDRTVDASRFTYDISGADATSIDLRPSAYAFNTSTRRFAFGVQNGADWQIVIGDLTDGAIVTTLESASAGDITSQGTPVVLDYDGEWVDFMLVSGTNVSPAYAWNVRTDEIKRSATYITLNGDKFPITGERLLPATRAEMHGLEAFSVSAGDVPVFYSAQWSVRGARFIADGAQALVIASKTSGEPALIVIARDGAWIGEIVGGLDDIFGTPDGFVGTFAVNGGGVALAHVATLSDSLNIEALWSISDSSARLIHVQTAGIPSGGLPRFTPQADAP